MTTVVKFLLKLGADVNAYDERHNTALIPAVRSGEIFLVELLIEHGADVNSHGWQDMTALHQVALHHRTPIAKLLIEHGADVNARKQEGETPLHFFADRGDISMMTLLIEHGADINAQSGLIYGNALQIAASAPGNRDIVRLLFKHGAKVDPPGQKWENLLGEARNEFSRHFGNKFSRHFGDDVQKRLRDMQRMCGEPSRRSGGITEVEIDNYIKESWGN